MGDKKYMSSTEYQQTTQKQQLEELGVTLNELKSLWKYLPRGYSSKIRNAKLKNGELKYPKNDGVTPIDNSYISKVKTLKLRNYNMLAELMQMARENKTSLNKVNRISKTIKGINDES